MSTPGTYFLNTKTRLLTTFKLVATGALADPDAVTVTIKPPNAAAYVLTYGVDAAVVKTAVGTYYADVLLSAPGTWFYGWNGAGTADGYAESYVNCTPRLAA